MSKWQNSNKINLNSTLKDNDNKSDNTNPNSTLKDNDNKSDNTNPNSTLNDNDNKSDNTNPNSTLHSNDFRFWEVFDFDILGELGMGKNIGSWGKWSFYCF